jgi:hypothetical protein
MKSKLFLKKSIAFCAMTFISVTGFSQPYQTSYGDLHIETRFDQVYNTIYGPIYNIAVTTNDVNQEGSLQWDKNILYTDTETQNVLGSYRSGSLEALLRMYETTCNIKYIWEFMEQANEIYNIRRDRMGGASTSHYWFYTKVAWHGRILAPLAHFVQLVKNESNLNNVTIPLAHRPNFNNKTTIGQFADMINTNNIEVMTYLLSTKNLWRGADECMCKVNNIDDPCTTLMGDGKRKNVYELNMQAPFGCALIYMYLVNGNTSNTYGSKAVEMARAYLTSRGGILGYNSAAKAYTWYHDGWQEARHHLWGDNFGPWSNWYLDTEHEEDTGHGSIDISFPILYNKYYSNITGTITGNQYFEDYQMVRFKNTFSQLIFSNASAPFNCTVFGDCAGQVPEVETTSDVQMNAKSWIDLYKYDFVTNSEPNKVYEILMNYYISTESTLFVTPANYAGDCIVGLAGLCQANRDVEHVLCQAIPPKSLSVETSFNISPNPTNEKVTIQSAEEFQKVVVTDLMGKEVLVSDNSESFYVSGLENGSYFVVVYFKNGTLAKQTLIVSK